MECRGSFVVTLDSNCQKGSIYIRQYIRNQKQQERKETRIISPRLNIERDDIDNEQTQIPNHNSQYNDSVIPYIYSADIGKYVSQMLQMIMTKLYYRIYKSIPAQQGVLKQLLHCSRLCHRYLEHHDYHKYTQ